MCANLNNCDKDSKLKSALHRVLVEYIPLSLDG